MPTLFILSGLPGTDTIEQALHELCKLQVEGEGYGIAYRIAADNLKLGLNVVADSCNTIELTRGNWERVAVTNSATFVNIEVTYEPDGWGEILFSFPSRAQRL